MQPTADDYRPHLLHASVVFGIGGRLKALQTESQATAERLREEGGQSMEDARGYIAAVTSYDPEAAAGGGGGGEPGDELHCMPPQKQLLKLLASDASVPKEVRVGTPSFSTLCKRGCLFTLSNDNSPLTLPSAHPPIRSLSPILC